MMVTQSKTQARAFAVTLAVDVRTGVNLLRLDVCVGRNYLGFSKMALQSHSSVRSRGLRVCVQLMQTGKAGLLALYFSPLKRELLEKTEDDSKGLLKIPQFIYYSIRSLQIVKICKHSHIINTLLSHITLHCCIDYVNYEH